MRSFALVPLAAALFGLSACGYHTLGAATHLPPNVRTLAVPVFATQTNNYHSEVVMTDAVIHELAARTSFRVEPKNDPEADATLHGTILRQIVTPLTYNSSTQQSSSFLVTMLVSVKLTGRDGKVLYQNPRYVYRQQYQSTTTLPTFLQEDPAAVERLSRDFAQQLVADILEGF